MCRLRGPCSPSSLLHLLLPPNLSACHRIGARSATRSEDRGGTRPAVKKEGRRLPVASVARTPLSGAPASNREDPADSREAEWRAGVGGGSRLLSIVCLLCRDISSIIYLINKYHSFIYCGKGILSLGGSSCRARASWLSFARRRCNVILSLH